MFTEKEFEQFFRLVNMSGSADQMDRINSRLEMPKFIEAVGRKTCDRMWHLIEHYGVTPATLRSEHMK